MNEYFSACNYQIIHLATHIQIDILCHFIYFINEKKKIIWAFRRMNFGKFLNLISGAIAKISKKSSECFLEDTSRVYYFHKPTQQFTSSSECKFVYIFFNRFVRKFVMMWIACISIDRHQPLLIASIECQWYMYGDPKRHSYNAQHFYLFAVTVFSKFAHFEYKRKSTVLLRAISFL